jgi:hypothetical protein
VAQQDSTRNDAVATPPDPEPTTELNDQSTTISQEPQAPEQPIVSSPPRSSLKSAAIANDEMPSEEDSDKAARLSSHPGPTITQSGNESALIVRSYPSS